MNYRDILEQVGYPTDILTLDFESYYDDEYSLKKMSTIEYINDSRFELLGLGLGPSKQLFPEGPLKNCFIKPDEISYYLSSFNWDNITVIVQQARFDITILQTKFGIIPKYIIDLKDLAKHYDARMSAHLKDLAKMFGLKPKGETVQFKGLHWDSMTEEQRKALVEYTLTDSELETGLFKILLPKLTNPEFELRLMQHTLDLWLHKTFNFDADLADVLKVRMRIKIDKTLDGLNLPPSGSNRIDTLEKYNPGFKRKRAKGLVSGNKSFVKLLEDALPENESMPMKAGKKGNIPALAQDDDGCKWLLAHTKPEVANLMAARKSVKSWPLHIARIDNMERQANANGGNLRTPLNYYAGHTGRWGGTEGINLHNLGGRGRAGSGIDPLIGQMRELLRALLGCTLGIGDSAQIEARILAWLAGQDNLLKGFTDGEDIYSEFATTLFQIPIRKAHKTDPEPVAKMLDIRRGFGKDAILGCGFGMGVNKFYQRCLQNSSLRPLFDRGIYNKKFIERLIKTYRGTYKRIPEYWTYVERAFRQCIKFSHLQPTVGQIKFSCQGSEVQIELPSTRHLYYRHARIDKKNTIKYHWGALWGGSITENIVQSIARDLLGYWILECEKAGLPVTLHVHDEIICMIKKDSPNEPPPTSVDMRLDDLKHILCSLPDWAEGLPVGAEVKESEAYCK